jgi:hypothetical protein
MGASASLRSTARASRNERRAARIESVFGRTSFRSRLPSSRAPSVQIGGVPFWARQHHSEGWKLRQPARTVSPEHGSSASVVNKARGVVAFLLFPLPKPSVKPNSVSRWSRAPFNSSSCVLPVPDNGEGVRGGGRVGRPQPLFTA